MAGAGRGPSLALETSFVPQEFIAFKWDRPSIKEFSLEGEALWEFTNRVKYALNEQVADDERICNYIGIK